MSSFEYSLIIDEDRWSQELLDYQNVADKTFKAALDFITQEFELELFEYEKDFYCNLILTNDEQVKDLNNQFRGKDKPTNVLSFANIDSPDFSQQLEDDEETEIAIGEIFVALETMIVEAKEKNISLENHFVHLFVHGILHLLGFDHLDDEDAEEMEAIEIDILKKLNINNPYEE